MPTAITTERIAKLILANLNSASIGANDHSCVSRSHRPKFENKSSNGAESEYANIAVIGNTQITVKIIASPLLAIMLIIDRI